MPRKRSSNNTTFSKQVAAMSSQTCAKVEGATGKETFPTMPILLVKRILARYRAANSTAVVAPFQCFAAESRDELPVDAPSPLVRNKRKQDYGFEFETRKLLPVESPQLVRKRKTDGFTFDMPQKKHKVSVEEQVTTAVAVEEPWMTCEDVGSNYVKWLEHRWKVSTAKYEVSLALRKAALTKANLLQCEKALCEKVVQKAQAALKGKEQELQAVIGKDAQVMETIIGSFLEAQAISVEWARWRSALG